MTSRLKQILLKMVQLPSADQRWILRQLPAGQLEKFKRYKGATILESAQRFRNMDIKHLAMPTEVPNSLPAWSTQLALKNPLYTAIILEQGSYPWQSLFLEQFDSRTLIADMLETRVPDIKEPVKQALYDEWENNISPASQEVPGVENLLSFENYLEKVHG